MPKLNKDWITEKLIDFEYKKYVLLAYLQEVEKHFELSRLYPSLSELVDHYMHARALKDNRDHMLARFPRRLKGIDDEKFMMQYEKIVADDALMLEIESIIEFSIPKFRKYLDEGKKIYEFVEEHMNISPVGLEPLDISAGYLFLKGSKLGGTEVYEYHLTFFEQPDEKFRAIHTQYIRHYTSSIQNTFNGIKTALLRENPRLPNPAAYAVEAELALPVEETFLPVAKRMLVKYISSPGKA